MSNLSTKFKPPSRFIATEQNIWCEYTKLSKDYNCVTLGAATPDYLPPKQIREILEKVANSEDSFLHQYTRDYGHPRLVNVLSKLYSPLLNHKLDPDEEILVTVGSAEALFSSVLGHIDSGDEVIIIEPFFDYYEALVKIARGVAKFIPLRLKDKGSSSSSWCLDKAELENLFNHKTKMIILNNPHNPIGKVYSLAELEIISDFCIKFNVLCLSDEVYEWIVFGPNEHIRIATLPGMWERTLTICSVGKTFAATGWKLGWVYGPSNLLHNLKMVHQNSVYTGNTPMQEVIAIVLEKELEKFNQSDCYFKVLPTDLATKRDFLVNLLLEVGMKPTVPQGGCFVIADWSPLASKIDLNKEKDKRKDYKFSKWLMKNVGVQGIPPSAFYCEKDKGLAENYIRFCFVKKQETLEKAAKALKRWKI